MKSLLVILLLAIFEIVIGNMTFTNNVYNITKHINNTWTHTFKKKLYWEKETWYHLIFNYFLCFVILILLIIGIVLCATCIFNRNLRLYRISQCFSSLWIFVVNLHLFHNENPTPAPAPPASPAPPPSPIPGTSRELPELSLSSCNTHL